MTGRRAMALGSMLFFMSSASSCALLYDFGEGTGGRGGNGTADDVTASTGAGMIDPGGACAATTDCRSGFCVDGVCCDAACDTGCTACVARLTEVPDGTCAPVRDGTDPRDACAAEACTTGMCRAGQCEPRQDTTPCGTVSCIGGVKTLAPRCENGVCAPQGDEPCTSGVCDPSGQVCLEDCTDQGDCSATEFCDANGFCAPRLPNGTACAEAIQCVSGHCFVRGGQAVCCDEACEKGCGSCLSNDTAHPSGSCLPVIDGTDPRDACIQGGDVCGATGTCAAGSCAVGAANLPCGAGPSCVGASSHAQDRCDGNGNCMPGVNTSCHPYACDAFAMTCRTSCSSTVDCDAGTYCSLPTCISLLPQGDPCVYGEQCASGYCAPTPGGGICCDSACNGECELCAAITGVCGKAPYNTPCMGGAGICCTNGCEPGSSVCGG